jgi:hypothetical protein
MLRMPYGEENALTTITTENQFTTKSKLQSSHQNTSASVLDRDTNICDPSDPNDEIANKRMGSNQYKQHYQQMSEKKQS